jgi:hypothetical protein
VGLLGGLSTGTRSDGNDKRHHTAPKLITKMKGQQRLLATLAKNQLRLKRF